MLLATLNAGFAIGALWLALAALRKGLPFTRYGWLLLQTNAGQPDSRANVERRRAVEEGGRFLLGGLLWLGGSIAAFAGAAYFGGQALRLLSAP